MEKALQELEEMIAIISRNIKQLETVHLYELKAMNNHLVDLEMMKYHIKKNLGIN